MTEPGHLVVAATGRRNIPPSTLSAPRSAPKPHWVPVGLQHGVDPITGRTLCGEPRDQLYVFAKDMFPLAPQSSCQICLQRLQAPRGTHPVPPRPQDN